MPRPGPRMEQVAVRLDAETLAAIDAKAEQWTERDGVRATRSEVIRETMRWVLLVLDRR